MEQALEALKVYAIGKPILIEEIFPLSCPTSEAGEFIRRSRPTAAGWLSFYWGKTIEEYKQSRRDIGEGMALDWLEYVARNRPL